MSEDKIEGIDKLEIVIEFGRVVKPRELDSLPPDFLKATLDYQGISYTVTHIKHHGDGTSGVYNRDGYRLENND